MKIRLHTLYLMLPALLWLMAGCSKNERSLNTNVTPVNTIFAPADNISVKLEPSTTKSVSFNWDKSRAEDGSIVIYEVWFDKADGDFSNPVYKLPSDANGSTAAATVTHKMLNKIASMAGIAGPGTGTLKWAVFASKGVNGVLSADRRTIQVERPAGFADIPADLFLTGNATEGGTDISKAIRFKKTGDGTFELYTSLKPGTYQFTDKNSSGSRTFYNSGTALKEGGENTQAGSDTREYRINVDFNSAAVQYTEIKQVAFWFGMDWNTAFGDPTPAGDKANIKYVLDYVGNSTWKAANKYLEMQDPGWGLEGRYKFRLKVNDGSGDKTEFWGSKNNDNPTPDNNTPSSYWYLYPVNDSQWDYSFKLKTDVQKKSNDIIVYFQPDKEYRTEIITH